MRHLRIDDTAYDLSSEYNSGDLPLPLVRYALDNEQVTYIPEQRNIAYFEATSENNVAFNDICAMKKLIVDGEVVIDEPYEFGERTFITNLDKLQANLNSYGQYVPSWEISAHPPVIKSYRITSEEEILETDFLVINSLLNMFYGGFVCEAVPLNDAYNLDFHNINVKLIDNHTIELSILPFQLYEMWSMGMNFYLSHSADWENDIYETTHHVIDTIYEEETLTYKKEDIILSEDGSNIIEINNENLGGITIIESDTIIENTDTIILCQKVNDGYSGQCVPFSEFSAYGFVEFSDGKVKVKFRPTEIGSEFYLYLSKVEYTSETTLQEYVNGIYETHVKTVKTISTLMQPYYLSEGLHTVEYEGYYRLFSPSILSGYTCMVELNYDASSSIAYSNILNKSEYYNQKVLNVPKGCISSIDTDSISELTAINVQHGNPQYDSRNNCNAIIETATNTLIYGCRNTIIPNSIETIGEFAFRNCSTLNSINIPSSVRAIKSNAFNGCSNLSEITCKKNNVQNIGANVFYGTAIYTNSWDNNTCYINNWLIECNNQISGDFIVKDDTLCLASDCITNKGEMTKITLPKSLKSISDYTFSGCTSLMDINLVDNIEYIGNGAFSKCDMLSQLVLPKKLKYIGDYAFDGVCKSYYSFTNELVIPDSVIEIGAYAFRDNSYLKKIVIGSNVKSIGNYAFSGLTTLQTIETKAITPPTIEDNTLSVGSFCGKLIVPNGSNYNEWINVPNKHLNKYGWGIDVETELSKLDLTLNGYDILCVYANPYGSDYSTKLYSAATSTFSHMSIDGEDDVQVAQTYSLGNVGLHVVRYRLSDGVQVLPSKAFYNINALVYCEISDKITSIGNNAFKDCKGLREVKMSDSVTSLGNACFEKCRILKNIELSNSISSIPSSGFQWCYALETIKIPDNVTLIGYHAFNYCISLTSLTIPDSVSRISEYGLCNNYSLREVSIGRNLGEVTNTPIFAFYNCPIEKIVVSPDNPYLDSRDNCNAIIRTSSNMLAVGCKNTIIPNTVTSIGASAFTYCTALETLTIPSSITKINDYTFDNCRRLKELTVEGNITSIGALAFRSCICLNQFIMQDSVTSLSATAFSHCYNLTHVKLSSQITKIPELSFYQCNNLKTIEWGNNVNSIGLSAFTNCYSLTDIGDTSKVTSFGKYMLKNTNIESFELSPSITTLPQYSFYGSSLTSITIPQSVTSLGDYCFAYCNKLKKITSLANTASTVASYTFYSIARNGVLYYPQGSDYSSWMKTSGAYLGYYNWTSQEIVSE